MNENVCGLGGVSSSCTGGERLKIHGAWPGCRMKYLLLK